MIHAQSVKYILMAMPMIELAMLFSMGIIFSIIAALWLGE